jgi:superfamily II DNA or RNA helicase
MNFINLDLDELRSKAPEYKQKNPFPHQTRAFEELSKNFLFPINSYKGGLLVLPTGGGKTFTAVNWICRNVLPKNIKVLWLAQSSYLLNQASASFYDNALDIINRDRINMRVVSSSSEHSNSSTISSTDDIL